MGYAIARGQSQCAGAGRQTGCRPGCRLRFDSHSGKSRSNHGCQHPWQRRQFLHLLRPACPCVCFLRCWCRTRLCFARPHWFVRVRMLLYHHANPHCLTISCPCWDHTGASAMTAPWTCRNLSRRRWQPSCPPGFLYQHRARWGDQPDRQIPHLAVSGFPVWLAVPWLLDYPARLAALPAVFVCASSCSCPVPAEGWLESDCRWHHRY